ncbi:MAG: TolC family protein [Muribaculaceae bacterium]|nr:TolC family protein [Muribaculaceae bacterium]
MKIKIFLFFCLLLLADVDSYSLELSLKDCKEMALQTDEDMRIAQNRVNQSNLDKGVAKTAYLPKIDGMGGAFYLTPDPSMAGMMDMQMRGVYLAGFSLTQPIYTGGKIINANKLAKVGQDVAKEQLEATRMDVLAEAEKSYWMYVAVLSKIDMINSYMTQLDSIYDYTRSAFELGLTTQLSVTRVETRRSELQYRLRQAQSGADLCRLALCRIIGTQESEPIIPTENLEDNVSQPGSFAGIDSRPELHLAQKNIEAKKYDVKMVLSDYLPMIGLQLGWNAFGNMKMKSMVEGPDGNYYPYTSTMNYNGFVGAVSLSVPIFHWGEGYKKVKKAKIEIENAELSLEKNRKLMELQAHQAYSNYTDGLELIESAEKAFSEAQQNLDMMQDQYEHGLMTLTDLLEAQSQWHSSYSNLIEAKTQYRINRIDYLRSVGLLE